MKVTARLVAAAAAILLSTAACADSPIAPERAAIAPVTGAIAASNAAYRSVHVDVWDLEGTEVVWTCGDDPDQSANENVRLEGQVIQKSTWSLLPNGALMVRINSMGSGLRGIGVESGDEYRYVEDEHLVANLLTMGTAQHWSFTFRLVNTRTKLGLSIRQHGTIAVNANGELVVDRFGEQVRCRE